MNTFLRRDNIWAIGIYNKVIFCTDLVSQIVVRPWYILLGKINNDTYRTLLYIYYIVILLFISLRSN